MDSSIGRLWGAVEEGEAWMPSIILLFLTKSSPAAPDCDSPSMGYKEALNRSVLP
jgi:hypothetical protein